MKKRKILFPAMCFMIGISIGTHAQNNTQKVKTYDGEFNTPQVQFYDDIITNTNNIELYDSSKLTLETLTNRNGKIIIEKVIGEVTNYKLDGKILNCSNDSGDYISYKRVDGAKQGDKIVTYFIYNPFTNTEDDVLTRMDFIIDEHAI